MASSAVPVFGPTSRPLADGDAHAAGDRIARVEVMVVKVPHHDRFGGQAERPRPFPGASYYFERTWNEVYATKVQTVLVRIESEDGLAGWGECQAPIVPEATAAIVEHLLGPMLLGRSASGVEQLTELMYRSMSARGHTTGFMLDAIAGLDIALWDLAGRRLGVPLHVLLGGACRDRLPSYVSGLRARSTAERVDVGRAALDAGYAALKLYLGRGVEADLAEARAVRSALGPDARLLSDVFWLYSLPEAIRLGRGLEELGVEWIEAPMPPEDIRGHAALCAALAIPIACGEPLRTPFQFDDWLAADALDVAQPDVARCGITFAKRIAQLAAVAYRPVAYHVGVCLAPCMAATWQLAAATPNFLIQEQEPPLLDLANRILREPLQLEAGEAVVPGGPGLGIEIERAALDEWVASRAEVRLAT